MLSEYSSASTARSRAGVEALRSDERLSEWEAVEGSNAACIISTCCPSCTPAGRVGLGSELRTHLQSDHRSNSL